MVWTDLQNVQFSNESGIQMSGFSDPHCIQMLGIQMVVRYLGEYLTIWWLDNFWAPD